MEHKHVVKMGNTENVIAVYVNTTLHMVNFEAATVLDEEQHWARQRVKEAIHIKQDFQRNSNESGSWTKSEPNLEPSTESPD